MTLRAMMAPLLLAALVAAAPYPNDAIQGGSDIQPPQAATRAKERAAGIAPPAAAAQQQTTDQQVNTLIRQSQTGIQRIPPNLLPPHPHAD